MNARMWVLVSMVLVAGTSVVAEDADEAQERKARLEQVTTGFYPSFVTGEGEIAEQDEEATPVPTPTPVVTREDKAGPALVVPEDPLPVEALGATALADPPTTLVEEDDRPSTETWHATRARVGPALATLRGMLDGQATGGEVAAQVEGLLAEYEAVVGMAAVQAPRQAQALHALRNRLERQLLYIADDYARARWRQLRNTEELLARNAAEFDRLLLQSDLDRGDAREGVALLPRGWNPGYFVLPEFAQTIGGWSADRLLDEYETRFEYIEQQLKTREAPSRMATLEMGELARRLATQTARVPVNARVPLRNAALRLEVLAEVIDEYLREDNRLYALRQLRETGRAIGDVRAYLEMPSDWREARR